MNILISIPNKNVAQKVTFFNRLRIYFSSQISGNWNNMTKNKYILTFENHTI